MKLVLKLFVCMAISFAIQTALFADNGREYKGHDHGWSVTGRVLSISADEKTLDICSNSHTCYTVTARGAGIYDGDHRTGFRVIHRNDLLQVYGRERDGVIEARAIYRLDAGRDSNVDTPERVTIYGSVKRLDVDRHWLELRVGHQAQRVRTPRETRVYSMHRALVLGSLREGQQVRIEGYRCGDEILASMVFIGPNSDRYMRNVGVRVVREASVFDRKLRVTLVGENRILPDVFDVNVPKDIEIARAYRNISVHAIHTGDLLSVEGLWNGSTFIPVRIMIDENNQAGPFDFGQNYDGIRGTIHKIDYGLLQFTFDSPGREKTVYADRARVWDGSDLVKFADLRRGDQVFVRGNIERSRVDAERIEIVR